MSTTRISLPERYRVIRHIANGGMASVWEAQDELLARPVAVKLLASHLSEDDRARQRFQREARAAAAVSNHPNVVTIYDVGQHGDEVYIVYTSFQDPNVAEYRLQRVTFSDAMEQATEEATAEATAAS